MFWFKLLYESILPFISWIGLWLALISSESPPMHHPWLYKCIVRPIMDTLLWFVQCLDTLTTSSKKVIQSFTKINLILQACIDFYKLIMSLLYISKRCIWSPKQFCPFKSFRERGRDCGSKIAQKCLFDSKTLLSLSFGIAPDRSHDTSNGVCFIKFGLLESESASPITSSHNYSRP